MSRRGAAAAESAFTPPRDYARDRWRDIVVDDAANAFGYRYQIPRFLELVTQRKAELADPLRHLLDDLVAAELKPHRSQSLRDYARRRCEDLARAHSELRTENAPKLPSPANDADGSFADF